MPDIAFVLNGRAAAADGSSSEVPLVFYLRENLGLTGTKYSCLQGLCGACTVHVDGNAARACQISVGAVAGRTVTTIEGLSQDGDHPLQKAWVAHQVAQCGFCQPGQIMGAAALLNQRPTPDDEEVRAAMSGHRCRCGTTNRVLAAINDVVVSGGAR